MITDPYTDSNRCLARLLEQYAKHPRLIVALDFDDSVFDFHKKDFTFPRTIELVKRAQALGFYIVIFTASRKERHSFIITHLDSIGIRADAINTNVILSPFGNDGKIFYNIFLDDRAGLGQALDILETLLNLIETK